MTPTHDRELERERDRDRMDRGIDEETPRTRDENEAVPEFERGPDLDRGQEDPVRQSER
jgi:hypothetical protein